MLDTLETEPEPLTVLYTGDDLDLADQLMQNVFNSVTNEAGSETVEDRRQVHLQTAVDLLEESIATGVYRGDFAAYLGVTLGGSASLDYSAQSDPVLAGLSEFNEENDQEQGASYISRLVDAPCKQGQTLVSALVEEYQELILSLINDDDTPYLSAIFQSFGSDLTAFAAPPASTETPSSEESEESEGSEGSNGVSVESLIGAEGCEEGDTEGLCALQVLIDEGKWLGL